MWLFTPFLGLSQRATSLGGHAIVCYCLGTSVNLLKRDAFAQKVLRLQSESNTKELGHRLACRLASSEPASGRVLRYTH